MFGTSPANSSLFGIGSLPCERLEMNEVLDEEDNASKKMDAL